jgi:hypothetical protein
MTYDLSRFSTQSFERFAQGLAMAQFGGATQVFGAGPDGGREATFEGRFTDVGGKATFDGYVVVQAKYRKVTRTPKEDLAWLMAEADAELRKFTNPRRKLRRPDYYVMVSNVVLTPGAADIEGRGGGTLDAMLAHLEGWKATLGVKQVFLWHADTLNILLDAHKQLHATFSSWVTPGDVLTAVLDRFARPAFTAVISRLVRDELKDQRGVKTQDSNQSQGRPIYVDDVFVDLPLDASSVLQLEDIALPAAREDDQDLDDAAVDFEDEETIDLADVEVEQNYWNIANYVMRRLADKLDSVARGTGAGQAAFRRVVVLGGPGQGKSTIGQFLAQLLRARLIADGGRTPPEIAEAAQATMARANAEGIDLSGPRRFPVHIALPRYADEISKTDDPPSLLRFVATHMAKIADEEVRVGDLRDWLGQVPALIILDGLDEVPRTSNRGDVIRAIDRLVADLHEADADVMLLVTSRPQGYLDDLDRRYWAHWRLADLDTSNAIRFAARLGEVLVPEFTRRLEVLSTLTEAANDPSTAPLMISPLQISLLFSLVVTRNDIPKDRWTLFERHYETLRDREIAKGGPNGELVRQYLSEIDRIHYDSGFILQVRAERAGNASAHFTPGEFEQLILRNLKESIVDPGEAAEVARRLMDIATTRLVFLGDRNEGRIAFDVRSLQEFMAAARLMVSPEAKVKDRLTAIAFKSHWAHVFRIACSKVYAQAGLQELRDDILEILDKLDRGDHGAGYREMRAGARLACNLLNGGTAGARQTDKLKLMVRAVGVLEIEDSSTLGVLAAATDTVTQGELKRAIETGLKTEGGPLYANCLRLLVMLSRQSAHSLRQWAVQRLTSAKIAEAAMAALDDLTFSGLIDSETRAFATEVLWAAGPLTARKWHRHFDHEIKQLDGLKLDQFCSAESSITVHHEGEPVSGLAIIYRDLAGMSDADFNVPAHLAPQNAWHLVAAALRFAEDPGPETLALALESAGPIDADNIPGSELPWPLTSCLSAIAQGYFTHADLAAQVRAGRQGDRADWERAEARWATEGLSLAHVPHSYFADLDLRRAGETGPPARRIRKSQGSRSAGRTLLEISGVWPARERMSLLQLMWFLCETPQDAAEALDWIQDDLLELSWPLPLCRSVAALIRLCLVEPVGAAQALRLLPKVPPATVPFRGDELPEGLIDLLKQPATAPWAAIALHTSLPLNNKSDLAALAAVDARHFAAPVDATAEQARALLVLRLIRKTFSDKDLGDASTLLLQESPELAFSAQLRKIYRGQKENDAIEGLVCTLAEAGLERDFRHRPILIKIITELTASRHSAFDDEGCLRRLGLPTDVDREPDPTVPV